MISLGVAVSSFSDLVSLAESGYISSTEEFMASLTSTVIKNGLVAYLAGIISSVTAQVVFPELPVVVAVIGNVAGAIIGYGISLLVSEAQLLEYLTEKLTWLFNWLTANSIELIEKSTPVLC